MEHPIAFVFFVGLIVIFFAAVASALMRSAGKTVAGFRPRFRGSFTSCVAGFLAGIVLELLFGRFIRHETGGRFFLLIVITALCAVPLFTVLHTTLVRNRADQGPTFSQAIRLALLQVIVGLAGATLVWLMADAFAATPVVKPV